MRALAVAAILLCCYLHFRTPAVDVTEDSLNTRQSAIRARRPTTIQKATPAPAAEAFVAAEPAPALIADAVAPEDEVEESYAEDEDTAFAVPWADIEDGWKTELKNFLVESDPDRGEEIYNAYLEEKRKFAERIDDAEAAAGVSTEPTSSGAHVEYDGRAEEFERAHQDNLREIFGDHYQPVRALHQEYVDSVQGLNRSDVKFSISL